LKKLEEKLGEWFYDDAIVKLSPDGEIFLKNLYHKYFIDNGLEYLYFLGWTSQEKISA